MMQSDVGQDGIQGADFQGAMVGNRNGMRTINCRYKPHVTSTLMIDDVTELSQCLGQRSARNIARDSHKTINSSRT